MRDPLQVSALATAVEMQFDDRLKLAETRIVVDAA
jgi:hypothetical protein